MTVEKKISDNNDSLNKKTRKKKAVSENLEDNSLAKDKRVNAQFRDLLLSIDFKNSRLLPEYLQRKSKSNQPCGDFEYAAKWIANKLDADDADKSYVHCISELDQSLWQIVLKYKETVENGYAEGAFRAREALLKGFANIRFSLPAKGSDILQDDEFRQYVQTCCSYLSNYIVLIEQSVSVDIENENLKRAEQQYKSLEQEIAKRLAETEEAIFSDYEVLADYDAIATAQSTAQFTPRQRDLYVEVIDLGVKKTICEVRAKVWQQSRIRFGQLKGQADVLYANMARVPVPNYGEKVKSQINDMIRSIVEEDRRIEEGQAQFDDLRGQISAMENLPGEKARRVYEAQAAERLAKELVERAAQSTETDNRVKDDEALITVINGE